MVYGVNPAGAESHARFEEKHALAMTLIADKGGRIARRYRAGLWLVVRPTAYLISPDGRIAGAWHGRPGVDEIIYTIRIASDSLRNR